MTQQPTLADPKDAAFEPQGSSEEPHDSRAKPREQLAFSGEDGSAGAAPDGNVRERGTSDDGAAEPCAASEGHLDAGVVDELTRRLPTAELVKIIKGALECGRRNLPFTESDLLRAMTFGSSAGPVRPPPHGTRAPRR